MARKFAGACLALGLAVGCSHPVSHAAKCKDFSATSDRLTSERDTALSAAKSAPRNIFPDENSPTQQQLAYEEAQRTLAELYVQDTTGCSTPEDKARAQAALDGLSARP